MDKLKVFIKLVVLILVIGLCVSLAISFFTKEEEVVHDLGKAYLRTTEYSIAGSDNKLYVLTIDYLFTNEEDMLKAKNYLEEASGRKEE